MESARPYSMDRRSEAVAATRGRILEATVALLHEQAYEDITLAGIARAAGVSHQTVLNHFDSKEGVARAAVETLVPEVEERRDRVRPGDVRGALRMLVGEYEDYGDANVRWAMTSERLGSLADAVDGARSWHQGWLERVFGERLPPTPAARRRAVNALHAATDVYTWKLLRRDLGLPRAEVERTMAVLVEGVLLPDRSTP